jgi:hypothetical protein
MFPLVLYKHRGKAADQILSLDEWNQVGLEVQALEKTLNEALGNPANEPGDNVVSPPWSLTVSALTWGKQTQKGRLIDADDAGDIQIRTNWKNISPIAKDDVAYAGWMMRLGGVVDEFSIWRADTAIPSVASALVKVNTAGKLTAKGQVQAGGAATPAAEGWSALNLGNASTNPGYVAFHIQDGTRRGYVGWKNATTTHLQIAADVGCAGWEFVVPASDDGVKITNATQPSLFFDTPARAGIWFGNTANTGRWFLGHEASGGAGMGLRMYNAGAGGDVFKFLYNGDLFAAKYWQGMANYCWLGGTAQNTVVGEVALTFSSVISNPGNLTILSSQQIVAPANTIVALGVSMWIQAGTQIVYISQWDPGASVWRHRASMSGTPGVICGYNVTAVLDTRYGTQFAVFVNDNTARSGGIIANNTGPYFWAIVLGRV